MTNQVHRSFNFEIFWQKPTKSFTSCFFTENAKLFFFPFLPLKLSSEHCSTLGHIISSTRKILLNHKINFRKCECCEVTNQVHRSFNFEIFWQKPTKSFTSCFFTENAKLFFFPFLPLKLSSEHCSTLGHIISSTRKILLNHKIIFQKCECCEVTNQVHRSFNFEIFWQKPTKSFTSCFFTENAKLFFFPFLPLKLSSEHCSTLGHIISSTRKILLNHKINFRKCECCEVTNQVHRSFNFEIFWQKPTKSFTSCFFTENAKLFFFPFLPLKLSSEHCSTLGHIISSTRKILLNHKIIFQKCECCEVTNQVHRSFNFEIFWQKPTKSFTSCFFTENAKLFFFPFLPLKLSSEHCSTLGHIISSTRKILLNHKINFRKCECCEVTNQVHRSFNFEIFWQKPTKSFTSCFFTENAKLFFFPFLPLKLSSEHCSTLGHIISSTRKILLNHKINFQKCECCEVTNQVHRSFNFEIFWQKPTKSFTSCFFTENAKLFFFPFLPLKLSSEHCSTLGHIISSTRKILLNHKINFRKCECCEVTNQVHRSFNFEIFWQKPTKSFTSCFFTENAKLFFFPFLPLKLSSEHCSTLGHIISSTRKILLNHKINFPKV